MDPKVIKKTQDTLGKIIKKPPLTEKLLGKPPFRFLHDVISSVIKTTGFMKGLFSTAELSSENIKDKESKVAFLQRAIDFVSLVTGKLLSARPQKIVAGSEPEKTNDFLQSIAEAVGLKVNNDEYVKKFTKKTKDGSEEKKDTEKEQQKKDKPEEKGDTQKSDRKRSRDRKPDESREHSENRKKTEEDQGGSREARPREKKDKLGERKSRKKADNAGKENEHPNEKVKEEDDTQESPSRIQRPTSAKGSRKRREEDEAPQKTSQVREQTDKGVAEDDVPPQVLAARKVQRPPSARPAPPRPKQDTVESEPAMRLGTGKPSNIIVDDGKHSDDEDDTNFVVEESAPPPVERMQPLAKTEAEDDTEHGALVKRMLETKKEFEEPSQGPVKKTEIERSSMSDAARRKQREQIKKEIDKLCASIQTLTRCANPLGKIMDYVQEDIDSMQKELEKWRSENREHALTLKRESGITDRSVEPLKADLTELDQAILDKLDLIAATKCKIIENDTQMQKLLTSMSKS